jgi:hypothetical protein
VIRCHALSKRYRAVMSGAARQRNTKIKALVVLEHQL